jgi:LPS export ABC transporter protein LptC
MAQALMVLPSQTPDIEIKTFELLETEENWRSLELKSPHAEIFKKQELIGIENPDATIWNKAGNATKLKGSSGIINSQNGNVQVSGSAQIEAQNGMVFSTETIVFENKMKIVSSSDPVTGGSKSLRPTQQPSLEIKGTGLKVDIKTQSYSIESNVTAKQSHQQDFFNIESESASIYPINNKAQFSGKAKVTSKTMQLTGESALLLLDSESSETKIKGIEMSSSTKDPSVLAKIEDFVINSKGFQASFSKNGSLVESKATGSVNAVAPSGVKMKAESLTMVPGNDGFTVNLERGVRITIDDRIATCEEAVYYPSSGNIILKKFASVIRKDQELHGDLIRLSTQNSEVTVEQASGTMSREALKKKN